MRRGRASAGGPDCPDADTELPPTSHCEVSFKTSGELRLDVDGEVRLKADKTDGSPTATAIATVTPSAALLTPW
jgi:hypothetical protein